MANENICDVQKVIEQKFLIDQDGIILSYDKYNLYFGLEVLLICIHFKLLQI